MNKVEPRTLPGFMELYPHEQLEFDRIKNTIIDTYKSYGFYPLDTPIIEYSEVLLAKAGGETEKQIYRFNKGDNDLSLRFDLTVPLARYTAEHYNELVFPFKRYQMSKVFRGERPQKGRFREFYQCDIDVIGQEALDLLFDAEIPTVIYNVFQELNIGKFTIRVNNRKILNGFFESLNLENQASDILRVIDKIDKIGADNVTKELMEFNIDSDTVSKIMSFIGIKGSNDEVIQSLRNLIMSNEQFVQGVEELNEVINGMSDFNVPEDYFKIDLTIARGLDYYTGTVYETILDDYPRLGSVCSGGRYENLTGYYTDEKLPGIGISIGLTRLFSQLKEIEAINNGKKSLTQVLVIPFDRKDMNYTLNLASKIRTAGINTDVYYQNKGMKQKMKYADRLDIPYVILIGEDEVSANKAMLKNMLTGEQQLLSVEEIIEQLTK